MDADRLAAVRTRHDDVSNLLADPAVHADRARATELNREHATLRDLVAAIDAYERLAEERADLEAFARGDDADMADL